MKINLNIKHENNTMYGSWDMEHDRQHYFSYWTVFCPLTLLITQKIKILKKWKKTPGDIIILHKFTINDNHMMYGSWDMKCDRQNFLSFGVIFCPLIPPNNPENQDFLKMKKASGGVIILHMCTKNHDHMLHCSWDMVHDGCNCYFSF